MAICGGETIGSPRWRPSWSSSGCDVIVVAETRAIRAAKQATDTIPIVMNGQWRPGVVSGLLRAWHDRAGTSQGLTNVSPEVSWEATGYSSRRRFQELRVWPSSASRSREIGSTEPLHAQVLGVQLQLLKVQGPDEFERHSTAATRERAGALLVLPSPLTIVTERRIARLRPRAACQQFMR